MPPDNIYNSTANPVSPYKSWIPPSHSCYIPEAIEHYLNWIDCSEYQIKFDFFKKTKKEVLEIE